jgi:hypothetical protein
MLSGDPHIAPKQFAMAGMDTIEVPNADGTIPRLGSDLVK